MILEQVVVREAMNALRQQIGAAVVIEALRRVDLRIAQDPQQSGQLGRAMALRAAGKLRARHSISRGQMTDALVEKLDADLVGPVNLYRALRQQEQIGDAHHFVA